MPEFSGQGANLQKSVVFSENLRFGVSLSPYHWDHNYYTQYLISGNLLGLQLQSQLQL